MRTILAAAIACGLGGCAVFSPYDSEFMCSATDDHGRCVDVDGAYAEAVAGRRNPRGRDSQHADPDAEVEPAAREAAAYSAYRESEYREMRSLLDQPVTPLVKPPKVLRTLITAYPSSDRTLYTPRYVFWFADEGAFVIGDYLNALPPARDTGTLQPFGER